MMDVYEAPAKLNLSLLVSPPRSDGYHPVESLVQTIEWCDLLEVENGHGTDALESDIEDNLIEKALDELRRTVEVPPMSMRLIKEIPLQAGLGGGSSDAAAGLRAAGDRAGLDEATVRDVAARVGADVPLFLTGGTLTMRGVGDQVAEMPALEGFAVAVVVADFGMSTAEVYRRWDEMEGPEGWAVPTGSLPPALRGGVPMRNDLLPAALDIEPRLGDFMADVAASWGSPVSLTGSGSACFGYFSSVDEATDAASGLGGRGAGLRRVGVRRVPD